VEKVTERIIPCSRSEGWTVDDMDRPDHLLISTNSCRLSAMLSPLGPKSSIILPRRRESNVRHTLTIPVCVYVCMCVCVCVCVGTLLCVLSLLCISRSITICLSPVYDCIIIYHCVHRADCNHIMAIWHDIISLWMPHTPWRHPKAPGK